MKLPLEELVAKWKEAGGNAAEVSRQTGIPVSTVKDWLKVASSKNVGGIGLQKTPNEELPIGQIMRGVSTYFGGDGTVRGRWIKTQTERNLLDFVKAIKSTLSEYKGLIEPSTLPEGPFNDELLTVYPIVDHHLGMYAWKKETGESYDLDIASSVFKTKMAALVSRAPASRQALILGLGDFYHADNNKAMTPEHGNHLDVDSRWQKVLHMGVEMHLWAIDLALSRHEKVLVRILPGNHDPQGALALTEALWTAYYKDPRVTIDIDPSRFFVLQWGNNMLAATHGDKTRPTEMPSVMATRWPKIWGDTDFRYALLGHIHHVSKGSDERGGVIYETFQTLAAKDSWNSEMGHLSGRSMSAIVYDVRGGEYDRMMEHVRKEDLV